MTKRVTTEVLSAAKKLRAAGFTHDQIGKQLGFTGGTIHCALDPAYAARRRQQVNAARQARGGDRPTVPERKAPPPIEFDQDAYSQPVYRKFVPNRTALGSGPLTPKGEGFWITLPMVSILRAEA